MKKRFAAHQIIISSECKFKQYVVEMEGRLVSRIFPLTEEIAFTEWIGGIIILSPYNERTKLIQLPMDLKSVLMFFLTESMQEKEIGSQPFYAWHISSEEISTGIIHTIRQL